MGEREITVVMRIVSEFELTVTASSFADAVRQIEEGQASFDLDGKIPDTDPIFQRVTFRRSTP